MLVTEISIPIEYFGIFLTIFLTSLVSLFIWLVKQIYGLANIVSVIQEKLASESNSINEQKGTLYKHEERLNAHDVIFAKMNKG